VISLPSMLALRNRAGEAIAKPGEFMPCDRLNKAAEAGAPPGDVVDADESAVAGGGGQPSPASESVGEAGCAYSVEGCGCASGLDWSLAEGEGSMPIPSPVAELANREGEDARWPSESSGGWVEDEAPALEVGKGRVGIEMGPDEEPGAQLGA
jgi:hypothetical protein